MRFLFHTSSFTKFVAQHFMSCFSVTFYGPNKAKQLQLNFNGLMDTMAGLFDPLIPLMLKYLLDYYHRIGRIQQI